MHTQEWINPYNFGHKMNTIRTKNQNKKPKKPQNRKLKR